MKSHIDQSEQRRRTFLQGLARVVRAHRFTRKDLGSLIIMRMLPWAGANVSTFLAGTYQVPLRVHVISVLVGSLPGSIIYALLGAGIVAL